MPPVLLDLCSVAFMHRFSSQSWWDHISHHFSADLSSAFDEIVRLKVCSIFVELATLRSRMQIFLDRPSDRVGAIRPRNAPQARPASLRSQVVPARPPVYVGQDPEKSDEGWGRFGHGCLNGSRPYASQLFVLEHARVSDSVNPQSSGDHRPSVGIPILWQVVVDLMSCETKQT